MGCGVTDPTLTISIDRTSLSLSPLAFSGANDGTTLGVVSYQPPALQWRVTYMPDSIDSHGSEAVGAAYQQALLSFDWVRDGGATETQVKASFDEVVAALGQFSYTVTTQVSGAPAQVWAADPGALAPSPRTYADLANRTPVFTVTIPVYPIAS
jgi:hypothetical protein